MQPEVWAVWPSAQIDLCEENTCRWNHAGYKVAVLIDQGAPHPMLPDLIVEGGKWKGYPTAINQLCHMVPGAVVVCAGDDIHPSAEAPVDKIYAEFMERFPDTFGVMQPTGDRFGSIDDVCPSPWIGRAFIDEAYDGAGPFWPDYYHYFCDEELKLVAEKQGALWQRPDLSQYHDHWQRAVDGCRPAHLMDALSNHKPHRKLFDQRKHAGFPQHERIPNHES